MDFTAVSAWPLLRGLSPAFLVRWIPLSRHHCLKCPWNSCPWSLYIRPTWYPSARKSMSMVTHVTFLAFFENIGAAKRKTLTSNSAASSLSPSLSLLTFFLNLFFFFYLTLWGPFFFYSFFFFFFFLVEDSLDCRFRFLIFNWYRSFFIFLCFKVWSPFFKFSNLFFFQLWIFWHSPSEGTHQDVGSFISTNVVSDKWPCGVDGQNSIKRMFDFSVGAWNCVYGDRSTLDPGDPSKAQTCSSFLARTSTTWPCHVPFRRECLVCQQSLQQQSPHRDSSAEDLMSVGLTHFILFASTFKPKVPAIVVGLTAAPPWFPWQNVVSFRPNSFPKLFQSEVSQKDTHSGMYFWGGASFSRNNPTFLWTCFAAITRKRKRHSKMSSSVTWFSSSFERSKRPNSAPPQPRTGRGAFSLG